MKKIVKIEIDIDMFDEEKIRTSIWYDNNEGKSRSFMTYEEVINYIKERTMKPICSIHKQPIIGFEEMKDGSMLYKAQVCDSCMTDPSVLSKINWEEKA